MNAQKSMYESSLSNLANSHHVQTSDAVIGNQIDDKLAVAQTMTNEVGNQLLSASSITGLAKISKFAKLSKIEKAKAVARAVLGKNPGDEVDEATREAQQAARARLPASPFESAPKPTVDSQEGVQDAEEQRDPDFRNDEFETRDPEGTDPDFFSQMGGRSQPRPEDGELDDEFHDASEIPQAGEAGEEGADITSSIAKGVTEAGDVEKTLTAATEASAATDEDPLGLVVTAGLGLATLIGGMFIHPSKPKVIQQAAVVLPNNYSVQAGLS